MPRPPWQWPAASRRGSSPSEATLAAPSRRGRRARVSRHYVGLKGEGGVAQGLGAKRERQLGPLGGLWHVLHQPALMQLTSEVAVFALYPLIPWIGVMAAGYALGPVMLLEPARRRRRLVGLGAAVTLGFIVLRATNG